MKNELTYVDNCIVFTISMTTFCQNNLSAVIQKPAGKNSCLYDV